jgi:phosphatidate cytidylyltransferase
MSNVSVPQKQKIFMSNLSLRIIFGAFYVAVMIAGAVLGHPYFGILMAIIAFFTVRELSILAGNLTPLYVLIFPALYGAAILVATFMSISFLSVGFYLVAWLVQLGCLFISYTGLRKESTLRYWAASFYLVLPVFFIAIWYLQNHSGSMEYILFYLITIWLYDSMAYVVGKLVGKNPIFPKVSPKKTIEGAVGGAIVTIIIITVLNHYWLQLNVAPYVLAAVVVFFATFGDFVESYMKRKLGVKDSGNLIPGHGGILDRLDSIYLSALPYLVILLLL